MKESEQIRKLLGQRIRQLRRIRGWTQQMLAERAGIDWKYVGAVERGERNPTLDNVRKIAQGFEIELYQLFFFAPEPEGLEEVITEEMIQDLLMNCNLEQKKLMWELIRVVTVSNAAFNKTGPSQPAPKWRA